MKKERLTIENRMLIEQLLRNGYKLKDIDNGKYKYKNFITIAIYITK